MAFIFAPSVEKFLFTFRGSALLSNQNSLLYSSFTSLVPFILLARTYTLLSLHTCNISICLCLHSKYTLRSQDGPSEKTPLLSSLPELVTQSAIHLRSLKQTHPWHIGPRIQPHGYRFANTASHDPPPKIRLPRSAFQDPSTKIRQPRSVNQLSQSQSLPARSPPSLTSARGCPSLQEYRGCWQ